MLMIIPSDKTMGEQKAAIGVSSKPAGFLTEEPIYGFYPALHGEFARHPYKEYTTFDDALRLRAQVAECSKSMQPSPVNHQWIPTSSVAASGIEQSNSTQPCIKSRQETNTAPGRVVLGAKMDTIRKELLRRQTDAPMVRILSAHTLDIPAGEIGYQTQKAKLCNRTVFKPVPPDWRPRYPEPDWRSFERFEPTPADERQAPTPAPPSTVSLEHSASLHVGVSVSEVAYARPEPTPDQITPEFVAPLQERPSAPTPNRCEASLRKDVKKLPTKKTTIHRPQTAPAMMLHTASVQRKSDIGETDRCIRFQVEEKTVVGELEKAPIRPMSAALPKAKAVSTATVGKAVKKDSFWVPTDEEIAAECSAIKDAVDFKLADNYDKALKQHGWRMEIPGDPYNLKRPHLAPRQSYVVTVPIPEVLPQPPPMRRENKETFFHNTIVTKPLSFDICPDFTSERYNAMRNKLRIQGKWNYSQRSISFVY